MRGPTAPKDPTQKRPSLYIMLDRAIAGMPAQDGSCRDCNFMEGRLIEQVSGICGDIDPGILKLLEHTDGFVKLVHSIGVSITAMQEEEKGESVAFTMQCYGKVDKYATGTNVRAVCPCDGEEVTILVSESGINEKDDIIGAFHFNFLGKCKSATVTLKFYLNDGYEVPELEVDPPVDFESEAYQNMIGRSLLSVGNTLRLKKAIEKARRGGDVVIAYIGGSITQGAGAKPIHTKSYAYLSYQGFCDLFTKESGANVSFVKAGVGGTPSELGVIRYEKEVTAYGEVQPDIVIVEFAVNDEGDETEGICFESLVRKIGNAPYAPAVIVNFAVFMNDWNLEDRLVPVGEHYDLPMVSVKAAVVPQFRQDTVITKRQYFYDIYHPTNAGHRVMADCLLHLFQKVDEAEMPSADSDFSKAPLLGSEFEKIELVDAENINTYGEVTQSGFDFTDEELQYVERDFNNFSTPEFEHGWGKAFGTKEAVFEMKLACRNIILVSKDSGNVQFGKADIYVDGVLVRTADPLANGWDHCNPQIILNESGSAEHTVKIVMHPGDEEKRFTILGFGVTR